MDVEKVIRERRSIRSYTNKKISKGILKELIGLANWAPSPSHAENREFVIITDEKIIKKMDEATGKQHYDSPVLIVVLSKKQWMTKKKFKRLCIKWEISDEKTIDKYFNHWVETWRTQDTAVATENLLLAAWNKKIGSCWLGVFDEEKIKKILNIPSTYSVMAVITLGYFDKSSKSTRKSAKELIHWEKW
jgi:nitroreductase